MPSSLRQLHEILHGRGSGFFKELRDDGPLRCVESGVEPWLQRTRRILSETAVASKISGQMLFMSIRKHYMIARRTRSDPND